MSEYLTRDAIERVPLNTPIPLIDSIPCDGGYEYHQNGTGIIILRGIPNPGACFARYELKFTGNIAIPDDVEEITPIATAIVVSGEQRLGSRSIFSPVVADEYGNVTSRATVDVPRGCCFAVSVEPVNGIVADPTLTPAPFINIIDGSLKVKRAAG